MLVLTYDVLLPVPGSQQGCQIRDQPHAHVPCPMSWSATPHHFSNKVLSTHALLPSHLTDLGKPPSASSQPSVVRITPMALWDHGISIHRASRSQQSAPYRYYSTNVS